MVMDVEMAVDMESALQGLQGVPQLPASNRQPVMLFPEREGYFALVAALKEAGCEMLADLCAVDYLVHPRRGLPEQVVPERFEVVTNLLSLGLGGRFRVRVQVPEDDPTIDSIYDIYPGSEAMEREAFDMFGIVFNGHPDMTRILMPDDWEGHPLRKDYGVGRVPVQFREAPGPR
ncbi:MAG: NADH-quinone oxidoreductase subunit C [Acidimicrobiales bacterium]